MRRPKLIWDDHLHVLHPQANLKELMDRHIHAINDPGCHRQKSLRFCSQTTRCATFSACLKSLEEDIRMNDDTLFENPSSSHTREAPHSYFLITSTWSLLPVPRPSPSHGPLSEELKALLTKMTSPFHHPYKEGPHLASPAFCYKCFELQLDPPGQRTGPSVWGAVCFCDSNVHKSVLCIAPAHALQRERVARCLGWHHHHGAYCSADAVGRLYPPLEHQPPERSSNIGTLTPSASRAASIEPLRGSQV